MAVESLRKTVGIALAVCLVCSILVSTSVIALKKRQDRNRKIERLKNILIAGDLLEKGNNIEKKFQDKIKAAYIELKTGKELPITAEPPTIIKIDKNSDIAGIKRIPAAVTVYFVKDNGRLDRLILPVYGKGLWSTMYGFLALDFADLNTIRGITFYEHGETPGLGGEIDNPRWQESWRGKKAFDEKGQVKISLAKGKAAPAAEHEVDGLSGATITARGVKNLVKFWLGKYGYGPFIKRLRKEIVKLSGLSLIGSKPTPPLSAPLRGGEDFNYYRASKGLRVLIPLSRGVAAKRTGCVRSQLERVTENRIDAIHCLSKSSQLNYYAGRKR